MVPEIGQTWVCERFECGREEVDKSRRNQDACAKMTREEEKLVRDGDLGETFDYDGERAGCEGG